MINSGVKFILQLCGVVLNWASGRTRLSGWFSCPILHQTRPAAGLGCEGPVGMFWPLWVGHGWSLQVVLRFGKRPVTLHHFTLSIPQVEPLGCCLKPPHQQGFYPLGGFSWSSEGALRSEDCSAYISVPLLSVSVFWISAGILSRHHLNLPSVRLVQQNVGMLFAALNTSKRGFSAALILFWAVWPE